MRRGTIRNLGIFGIFVILLVCLGAKINKSDKTDQQTEVIHYFIHIGESMVLGGSLFGIEVQEHLNNGWIPVGGIDMEMTADGRIIFAQALIKKEIVE